MGRKDSVEKTLESHNDVFSDIVNGLLFTGNQVVTEDSLSDAQTFSIYKMDGDVRSQDRDVAKFWNKDCIQIGFCGIENQSVQDYDMPLRGIGYDGAAYRMQLAKGSQTERHPVVTLVLYFGTEHRWTAPQTLKGCLSASNKLAPFVNDYKLNIFELAWLPDEQIALFRSDFREVLEYLRARRLHIRYEGSERQLRHIEEILDMFRILSGDDSFKNIEAAILDKARQSTGGVKMCDVIQAIKQEGISLGEQRGENTILSLFSKLYAAGRDSDVRRATGDREYLKKLMEEYQK